MAEERFNQVEQAPEMEDEGMMTEEQAHIAYLKERAQSIGLTFSEYMLFLIFETLDHSPLNPERLTPSPWEEGFEQEGLGGQENQEEDGFPEDSF